MRFSASPDIALPEDQTPRPDIAPRIIWPTMRLDESGYVDGDEPFFPDDHCSMARRKLGIGGAVSTAFRFAVRQARDRIWLLDGNLLREEASALQLYELFTDTAAPDIRIATAAQQGAEERAAWLKSLEFDLRERQLSPTPFQIQICLNLHKAAHDLLEIHDRYAIVDDVLWHCGATIGGLHHCINAISYGWSAHETKAVEFFERLWKLLQDDNDKRR
jgi:hypothetical protein